jgi:hypothetical protein
VDEGKLSAEVYECFAEAAKGFPWLQNLLAGVEPDFDRDILDILRGLSAFSGASIHALALIAERIDAQDG